MTIPRNKTRRGRVAVFLAISSVSIAAPITPRDNWPPRNDAWQIVGPGGGGTMIAPTISPHDPNVVVEHCDMTGAYITLDGGSSWRMFNLRGTVPVHGFDPSDPKVIYAGNTGVWRSEDRGRGWSLIFPDPKKNTVGHHRGDHGDYSITTDHPEFPKGHPVVNAIAVDPQDSRSIYVAFGPTPAAPASLCQSTDRGETWSRIKELGRGRILSLFVSGGTVQDRNLYLLESGRAYLRAGGVWATHPAPQRIHAASAGISASGIDPVIYATAPASWRGDNLEGGLYVSTDGGRTWTSTLGSLSGELRGQRAPVVEAIGCQERNPSTAYVGFDAPTSKGRICGIARTDNTGKTWRIVHSEGSRLDPKHKPSWIEERMPTDRDVSVYFDPPWSIGVAPTNGNICFATDLFRTFKTTDGGKSWATLTSVRRGSGWTTTGLDVTNCYGIHFDPHNRNRRFVTYTDIGLFRSEDRGKSWISSISGVPSNWKNTTYWVDFDPEVKGLMWGAFGYEHDLPRPKMWRRAGPSTFRGGVGVSTDGGKTWKRSGTGMPETATTHVFVDRGSPIGHRTLYACGFGRGVFKSTDNGLTWALKNNGIEKRDPLAWRIVRDRTGTLYLIIARRSESGEIGDERDGAVYRSTDGAEHWTKITLPEGCNGPNGLAVDPQNPNCVYLAAWGRMTPGGDTGGGVYRSTDRCRTWRSIFSLNQHVYDVTIDQRHPGTLFICGFDGEAYRSTETGRSWQRIQGYNFHWGHRVYLDPDDPRMIYISTFGGSLWHGPADGDPNALEDRLTKIPVKP